MNLLIYVINGLKIFNIEPKTRLKKDCPYIKPIDDNLDNNMNIGVDMDIYLNIKDRDNTKIDNINNSSNNIYNNPKPNIILNILLIDYLLCKN